MQTVVVGSTSPARGEGSFLVVGDGRDRIRDLDWFTDNGVSPLGYNNYLMNRWIFDFQKSLAPHRQPQVFQSETAERCADVLCSATGMDRVFFANSGTEATEAALKLARLWWHKRGQPGRDLILTLPNNFHGRTGLSMAASDSAKYHKAGFGMPPPGHAVLNLFQEERHYPDNGMAVYGGADKVPWHRVAAVITAPVRGNNVVEPYPDGAMKALRKLCDDMDTLLIFDEVQSGSGRAGFIDPAIDAVPDILCLGKGLAAGFPMSAMLARGDISDTFRPGEHFSTFGGSTNLVMHIAANFMEWVVEHGADIRALGERFRVGLAKIVGIADVKGIGMMTAFTPDYQGYDAFQLCEAAKSEGLLMITFRKDGQIKLYPPLNSESAEITFGLRALAAAMASVRK
jgi:acetylornithine/N-succinyldiaminopimelate aminotransferase